MSERSHVVPTPEGEYFETNRFGGLSMIAAVVAVAGLVLCVVAAFLAPRQFAYSWLFAFAFFFTLCAGCLFWTLVHHAVDAEWSVVVRRQLENIASLLPIMAIFFLPVILFRHHLYEWMTIPYGEDHLLDTKRAYLNFWFFLIRAIIILGFFVAASWFFRRTSVRQDRDGNPRFTLTMRKVAIASIFGFALSLTFGAFDWLMSLNYVWFSTMWGVYIFAGAAGSSMSLLVLVITWLRNNGYLKEIITIEHYHFMGKWMLAFTVFWAYIGFSQYMLIWYSNVPEETEYFILRNTESWNLLSLLLVIGRFFVPFALLLPRATKKIPKRLCMLAGWIIFMQLVDMYVVVLPELHRAGMRLSVVDFLPLLGIGATLVFFYLRVVGRTSLFPVRDPRLAQSLRIIN
ncbi:membrane protein [soil metagenome]